MERRTEPRMLCADLVDVRWKDKTGRTRRGIANLEDISLSGACLQMDNQIPANTMVRVMYPRGEFAGLVRYCHFRDIGFYIGVEFEVGSRWTQRQYKPLHLLDPRRLVRRAINRAINQSQPKPAVS